MPDPVKKTPVIFGEILFDTFENGVRVLGGAPFNVAWHLQGFGFEPVMISRVGQDDAGREVLNSMQQWNMDRSGIQVDHVHSTGIVQVSIHDNEPSYDIVDKQAYDHILLEECEDLVNDSTAGLLYAGSLALRHEISRNSLFSLASGRLPLFVDVNLRQPWWNEALVSRLLDTATWLKLNEDELQVLAGRQTGFVSLEAMIGEARRIQERYGLLEIIVTLGERGAVRVDREAHCVVEPSPVEKLVDTVGAGDALSAVCIAGILEGWDGKQALQRAVSFAAEICRQRGAITNNPALYRNVMAGWDHD